MTDREPAGDVARICRILDSGGLLALLRAFLDAAIELTGAERGFLVVPDTEEPRGFRVEAARGYSGGGGQRSEAERGPPLDSFEAGGSELALSETLVKEALATGRPIRLENALESQYKEARSIARLRLLSVLVVPIRRGGLVAGAVYLDTTRLRAVFTEETLARVARLTERVLGPLHEAALGARLRAAARRDLARLKGDLGLADLLGEDPSLARVLEAVACAAPTAATVLLLGESGSGKERLARAIHDASRVAGGPFVPVHCGAIPEALLESELFGHEKGAFTGATAASAGRVAAADGGTLFLDEVGELGLASQVKLLRLLEAGEIQRLGRAKPLAVRVRVVAATHRDLAAMAKEGRFREDLFYRLSVVPIRLPPLRARGEDVRLLAEAFLARAGEELQKRGLRLGEQALALLERYAFPGNVRELENMMRRAAIFARGEVIGAELLPDEVREAAGAARRPEARAPRDREELARAKEAAARDLERAFLGHVLAAARGRVAEAARIAGMNRTFLHELIQRHGIDPVDFRRGAAPPGEPEPEEDAAHG
jgi:transcriptional regulator with GAF, ATPase, and Fis domain